MGMLIVLMLREIVCEIVAISVLFTLLFAAVRMEKYSMSVDFHQSSALASYGFKGFDILGNPLTEIQPLNADNLLSRSLTIR